MSTKVLLGISAILGVALSFFIGLYIGGAPFRRYVALTGGASGIAATDLKNISDQLLDQHDAMRDASAIADRQRQTARIRVFLAALLYCRMPEQYREVASQSAKRLKYAMVGTDDRTVRAISFLASGTGGDKDGCFIE